MNSGLTGREQEVPEGVTIVSQTDLHGTITSVNDTFVRISGYSREELIGQPHNLLRHPDVPAGAFKDLWKTIQSGKPWSNLVKNRCKNGDHYWVEANVSPVLEKGQVIGYLSVRRCITDELKAAAEGAYAAVNAGKASLKYGYVDSKSQKYNPLNRFNPNIQLMLLIMVVSLGGISDALFDVQLPWIVQVPIFVAVIFYALYINRFISKRTDSFVEAAKAMAEGDFSKPIYTYGKTWIADLASSLRIMQIQMGATYEANRVQLNQTQRLTTALNNASTSMMVVNTQNEIIYMNKALNRLWDAYQEALALEFEDWDSRALIDSNLGRFNLGKSGIAIFCDDILKKSDREIAFAGITFEIIKRPVLNDSGDCIGSVIEWKDLTQEKQVEQILDNAMKSAAKGHTNIVLKTDGLDGFYLYTAENINGLLAGLNGAIEGMVEVMIALASGDIYNRVEKEFSGSLAAMKSATNTSLDNLSGIMMSLKQVSTATLSSAQESEESSRHLAEKMQEATATLQEVNTNMQGINKMQTENTQELSSVSSLAKEAMSLNHEARSSMDDSITAMQSITDTSERIEAIIGLIDGIAFQTNLLALNAAVEAARAGEHGRGFAVVAGEVRNLAGKSAEAAKDIKLLIQESGEKVNQGAEKVKATHAIFGHVEKGVSEIGSTLDSVVESIHEQQATVSNVSQAVEALDSNIQNNAELVDEMSLSSKSLCEQAQLLNSEVHKFKVNESTVTIKTNYPKILGVSFKEMRLEMRLWKTRTQSYLNGVKIAYDEVEDSNTESCVVGRSLRALLKQDASLEQLPIWQAVVDLHSQQHNMVKLILEARNQSEALQLAELDMIDDMIDEFTEIITRLDVALGELEEVMYQRGQNSLPSFINK
ncbi:MAG: methyl-accepting chemotaxis protein [Thiomicrorhabdus sp.]|nr:MAG: methyl-accepting chemotaxis protein [Thiomicrorhabdus sp.]